MRALNYRPHFTFAIYDTPEVTAKTAWETMLRAVGDEGQLPVEFRRICWFAGPPLVLWAEPKVDETLARWHSSINAAIDPAFCRLHYRPGNWRPHCTLGTQLPIENAMMRSLSRSHSAGASPCCST
ncbi:2'-5' RNA ligase family protein [Bradyrhizobium sp. 14AA]